MAPKAAFLYPRLNPDDARQLLEEVSPLDLLELRNRASTTLTGTYYYTPGAPVPEERLLAVREVVTNVVDDLGFPAPHGKSQRLTQGFDQRLSGELYRTMEIVPADAASEEVWSFLTLVLLPDAAVWRYPDRDPRRMTGHFRNAFRRLWWRAHLLGDGPDDAPAVLGEDQLVSITERPTLGSEPRVARALFAAFKAGQERHPDLPGMVFMRESSKRLLRFMAFVSIGSLTDDDLTYLTSEAVEAAAGSIEARMSSATA